MCELVNTYVCDRESERERDCVLVGEQVCVCVRENERDRERKRD